tara:strand:+ start:256 stop:1074 length:819 start_codon:yes stop_codon:yes gene_type:complete
MTYRIHITSSGPRTGTTLLTEVFKNCFNIDCSCNHEASIANSTSSFGKCNTVLTKNPSETKHLNKILNYVNNLYIICIIRDPRDMVVSYHGLDREKYFCGLNFWFDFLEDYQKLKNHPRFVLISYEDFTKNPDKVQRHIQKKIPFLKHQFNFSEYHLHAKPDENTLRALNELRPIESKGVGNWKKHKSRIKQQIVKHGNITDGLLHFNYELNRSWEKNLDNIETKDFISYLPENKDNKLAKKVFLLALFNFTCEKLYLNPDKIYKRFKKIKG